VRRREQAQAMLADTKDAAVRIPYFCSGCPHNTSTRVPDGMRAYAGIGCHFMAQWMDRSTEATPNGRGGRELGRRGAVLDARPRLPESRRRHLQSQWLSRDTFRASRRTNITYKILFNDASHDRRQRHEGGLTVDMIARRSRRKARSARRRHRRAG
jgi:indolepyruvate ferredoxin oxidoreductase